MTLYNIFLLSKTPNTQIVAQASLAQMIQAIFARVPPELALNIEYLQKSKSLDELPIVNEPEEILTEESSPYEDSSQYQPQLEGKDTDDDSVTDDTNENDFVSVTSSPIQSPMRTDHVEFKKTDSNSSRITSSDIYIKDVYFILRSLCKLSMRPIPTPEG